MLCRHKKLELVKIQDVRISLQSKKCPLHLYARCISYYPIPSHRLLSLTFQLPDPILQQLDRFFIQPDLHL